MSTSTYPSPKASVSREENIILNSVGATTHLCFTPLETGKVCDSSPLSEFYFPLLHVVDAILDAFMGGVAMQPYLIMSFHSPSILEVSKALVMSMKAVHRSQTVLFLTLFM